MSLNYYLLTYLLTYLQDWFERHSAQHSSLADAAQLGMVEAVHARQAAAEHRAPGGRDEEEGRGAGEDQGAAAEGREAQEGTRRTERQSAADEERSLPPTPG